MSENTQLNINYIQCNKEELDKIGYNDLPRLNKICAPNSHDIIYLIKKLGSTISPKLKAEHLLNEFSKPEVISLVKEFNPNVLHNLEEVGLLDKLDRYDVYKLIKELGENALLHFQKVGLLEKLNKYQVRDYKRFWG